MVTMPTLEGISHVAAFWAGLVLVLLTFFSALSTFVLPRSARSRLNRLVFGLLRKVFGLLLRFVDTYRGQDTVMAYYAPIGLMLLLPTWYLLILCGYTGMFWAIDPGSLYEALRLSGSSLFTLGFAVPAGSWTTLLAFSEGMLGLILVALLIAYLPTMYSAFSRREQAVNMLVVRAGSPPSALEMLQRFRRIHGLDKLGEYWRAWETWFADIEESHTTLSALVFFRPPRPEISWITAAGAVLDAAAITLACVDVPYEPSGALCIRAGYLALRQVASHFELPYPQDPHFPEQPISIRREEFEAALTQLAAAGLPLKTDREQAWQDFAGWRVNYDQALTELCALIMAPYAPWSSDRQQPDRPMIAKG